MKTYAEQDAALLRVAAGFSLATLATLLLSVASWAAEPSPNMTPPKASALDMVNALHTAFGEHHARAVRTKGAVLEGTFTPSKEARALTKAGIFAGGTLPVIARFSLFAGVPTLPDNNDGASPAGLGIKIREPDGDAFDIECNQHNGFIVATVDEFREFLTAVGASGPGAAHPTPVENFLGRHPEARALLASRTYPASYAMATYFGVNSEEFIDAGGHSTFVRYRLVPRAGEKYLQPDERKAMTADYLQQDVMQRVSAAPIVFDWYAQISGAGDVIENPAVAWPDSRKLVKLGTFSFNGLPADPEAAQKNLLFLPGQPHAGVEPADPMLVLRNTAYPISFGQRQ
jgi:catalase